MEYIKESIIESNVRFTCQLFDVKETLVYRRKNLSTTQFIWITLRPCVYDKQIFNPKALILIILN